MGNTGDPHQLQQLLDVAYGDEVALFHTIVSEQQVLLVKRQRSLYCFRLASEPSATGGGQWKQLWSHEPFFDANIRNVQGSFFIDRSGWVLVKNRTGLQFYRLEGNDLSLRQYSSDGRYHAMYGWNGPDTVFLMGRIYAEKGAIGVLTRNKRGVLRFEQMVESVVLEGGSQPLWQMSDAPSLPESWKLKSTWLGLAHVEGGISDQAAIVERSANAITVYKLDEDYQLQTLAHVTGVPFAGADKECILFGNVLGTAGSRDMLHFSATGLVVYEREGSNYRAVLKDTSFDTAAFGWDPQHWRTASLIDTTGDGRDELWLTGPQGIAGFSLTKKGVEKISNDTAYGDDVRYAKLTSVLWQRSKPIMIAVGGRKLFTLGFATPTESTPKPSTSMESANADDTCPEVEPLFTLHSHSGPIVEASLAEQLDTSMLQEPINPMRGSLDFAIPLLQVGRLFSLQTSKFITYQETEVDGSMGRGWSLQVDCVFVDRGNSIFAEDHRYYLVRDGSSSLLTAALENESSEGQPMASFSIEGNNQTRITFDRTQNQWSIVNDNGDSFTYGTFGQDKFIKMDDGSVDWPFPIDGKKYRHRADTLLPSVWYLIRHSDRAGQWMEYSYRGGSGTEDFLLDTITTSNGGSLRVSYTEQFGNTLLTGFVIRTDSYSQSVALQYIKKGEKTVRLQRISQQNKTVLQFSYDGPSGEMTEVVYPNGMVARFEYTVLNIDRNLLMNRFETFSHPRAAYGPSYLLIGDITKHGQLRLRLRDILGSDTVALAGSPIPLLGKTPVTNYEIFPGESYFAVLLHHEKASSELCLFETQADVWQATPTYLKLPAGTSVRSGQDFLLALQSQRVTVVERLGGKWKTAKSFEHADSDLMYYFSHGFLAYNDQQLKLFVRRSGQWTPTTLDLPPDLIGSSSAVFDHFDHPQETIDHLKQGIRPDALGMLHNIVVVRSLYLEGSKLYVRLHLLHLNRNHEVARREVLDILIEDLDTYTFNPPEQDGNTFVFGYRMEGGKFKLKVVEYRGKIQQEIAKAKEKIEQDIRDEPNAPEEEKQRYRKESLETLNNELEQLFRNITAQIPFAIDPSKLGVIINDAHVITASHKAHFDGVEWSKERIPQEELTMDHVSIKLGEKYRLVKTDRNGTFDLLGPNQSVQLNTETRDANDLLIRYPGFFAVQTNGSAVQLFDFARGELTQLPAEEQLEAASNQLAVISSTTDGKALLVRSMKSFGVTLENVVWRHDLIDSRQRKLTTFYEFDRHTAKPHGAGFLLSDIKIVPVDTEGPYGWYQEHYDFANRTRSTKSVYNSRGEFVKEIEQSPGGGAESDKPLNPDRVLTARDGKTIVADFRPFRISDQVVSYYGFEPYEQNRIGTGLQWTWGDGQVVQGEDGNHFLRLVRPSSSATGTFQPKGAIGTLVVSCWVRPSRSIRAIGDTLSVRYGGATVKGTVGLSVDGWTYVEVLLDTRTAFVVTISPGSAGIKLDVDHLRVSPAQLDLEVSIYDSKTTTKRSTMHGSGLLSHHLYDAHGNEMGRISEQGSIDSFSISFRAHNVRIEFKAALGEVLRAAPRTNNYSGPLKFIPDTAVLRFRYGGTESAVITVQLATRTFSVEITGGQGTLREGHHTAKVPPAGDLAIFLTNNRYSVWANGQLQLENLAPEARLDQYAISATGAHIWDAVLLYDTSVKVIYLTDFGMPKQILELQTPTVVALQEIVYDALNRPAIKTKWTHLDSARSGMLFAFRDAFVTNEERVWKSGLMEGLAAELNADCAGYPYSRTVYQDTPQEERVIQSVPGKPFAVDGAFAKHFGDRTRIDFLENLFPRVAGFRYAHERYPDQSIYVTVSDGRKRKVAEYVRAHHGDHHLTTFQYDANDRLILQLPPAYHEEADTFSRTTPFFGGSLSPELRELQRSWGTRYEYERESGLLTLKRTPDTGDVRYLYTPEGLLRFMVQPGSRNVMFFSYSAVGKLTQRGMLELDATDLPRYLPNESELPPSSNFVQFQHGANEVAPQHRHRVENMRKVSNDRVLSELLLFDHQQQLISNVLYSNANHTLPISYKYCKHQVHEINYPIAFKGKTFRLRYAYDHRGKVIALTDAASGEKFVAFENNSLGLPKSMTVQPNSPHAYRRTFEYNQPGYLTSIRDPYLTEWIDYVGTGYGGRPVGDGTVQTTRFNATWHGHSNVQQLKLKPAHFGGRRAKVCYDALTASGHVDAQGRPTKSLYPLLDLELPIVCRMGASGNHVAAALTGRGFPQLYGHKYDYGSHRQLIRAKYFQGASEESFEPLRKDAFQKIRGIDALRSANIWNALNEAGYIHRDCSANGRADCHGLPGKSLFHPTIANHPNAQTLGALLARVITARKGLSRATFDKLCAAWYRDDLPEVVLGACQSLWTTLVSGQFIGTGSDSGLNALNPELRELLSEYASHLPAIVDTLYQQLARALGHSSGDVQSYKIDANGNHGHFYTGFRRYRLEYVKNTNKLAAVNRLDLASANGLEEARFTLDHNEDGSVTQAMHKGIQRITYDPLFNRPTEIALTDGRRLEFDYNVRGQRLYKHVYDRTGRLLRKKYYVRDVQGKPLIEYEAIYKGTADGDSTQPLVRATIFLYAGDRLVGFIRNDQFYSVTLDHEGSVRVVVRNGEVVAAYDYLPYGELLRAYGDDPNGQLDYRFTGKEWDAETGLYDFHARLYDPELGRFYQMDPREQYASPYLYAGNSPVSLVDPDGQFAFLVVAALVVGGAYLGAAAANNSWNPFKWNLKKALIGGFIGGLIGGLAPAGIASGFTFLSGYIGATAAIGVMTATSVGFAYVSMSSANGSWDPSKWDWSKPGTWNALFTGSLTGATLFKALGGIKAAFVSSAGISRAAFVIVASGTTVGFLVYSGSKANDGNLLFWEWDWSKPGTIWGAMEGASFGLALSPKLKTATQHVGERLTKFKEIGKALQASDLKAVGTLLKEEAKAWKQIYLDVITGKEVKEGLAAGKAAGATGGTILLPKIPDQVQKTMEELLAIANLLDGLEKRKPRSIEYSNATLPVVQFNPKRFDINFDNIGIENDYPDGMVLIVSSSGRLSHWINTLLDGLFGKSESIRNANTEPQSKLLQPYSSKKAAPKRAYEVPNCFPRSSDGVLDRVVCYESHGMSYVFPHVANGESTVTEDSFSRCYPIEYDGLPSVACSGTSSSYVYTPHRRPVNYLDHLNGTLTLLLVAPAVARNVASFFGTLLRGKTSKRDPLQLTVSEQKMERLNRDIGNLHRAVKNCETGTSAGAAERRWMSNVLEDIDEDVRLFVSSNEPSHARYNELNDRIDAMNDELIEMSEIGTHKPHSQDLFASTTPPIGVKNKPSDLAQVDTLLSKLLPSSPMSGCVAYDKLWRELF